MSGFGGVTQPEDWSDYDDPPAPTKFPTQQQGTYMESVVIDGITYRPDTKSSDVRIVILQRGWVMVGRFSQDGDICTLDNAQVIRQWGTKKGLGELVGGPVASTVLDPTGHVEFHILTVVATISADEDAWAPRLS